MKWSAIQPTQLIGSADSSWLHGVVEGDFNILVPIVLCLVALGAVYLISRWRQRDED